MAALVAAAAVAMEAAMDIPMGTCESFFVLHTESDPRRLLLRLQPFSKTRCDRSDVFF